MAGKTTDMSKIKQVMMLHSQGYLNRKISRELNLDKGTVNTYVRFVETIVLAKPMKKEATEIDVCRYHNYRDDIAVSVPSVALQSVPGVAL
jgi:hypothetical protein